MRRRRFLAECGLGLAACGAWALGWRGLTPASLAPWGAAPGQEGAKTDAFVFVITDKCTACGQCQVVCPVGAISREATKYKIDQALCIACGTCKAECPIGAIVEKRKED